MRRPERRAPGTNGARPHPPCGRAQGSPRIRGMPLIAALDVHPLPLVAVPSGGAAAKPALLVLLLLGHHRAPAGASMASTSSVRNRRCLPGVRMHARRPEDAQRLTVSAVTRMPLSCRRATTSLVVRYLASSSVTLATVGIADMPRQDRRAKISREDLRYSVRCGRCGTMLAMTQAMHDVELAPWAPDDSTFGARLALVRQHMRWNAAEAARECGINADSWRLWEEGRRPRDLMQTAQAIAARTGCDFRWLIMGPSRADLERRMRVTACSLDWYDPRPDMPAMPVVPGVASTANYDTHSGPSDRLPLTRAVERTRPAQRPVQTVSLLAMA